MSKYLQVPNGDYKISVRSGGFITLDTGIERGQVTITGDLVVEGNTTTVSSEDLSIRDNIIIVNDGETGAGITLRKAGLQVDRGTNLDALFVFNEDFEYTDPVSQQNIEGQFGFQSANGSLLGIRTNAISTGGGDLYLINNGQGVISVTGTTNYEAQVFEYNDIQAGLINIAGGNDLNGIIDDDSIPNARSVVNYIESFFAGKFQDRIDEGFLDPTFIEVQDQEVTGLPSVIKFGVDSRLVAEIYKERIELNDIRIEGTKIETVNSNSSLVLSAPGTGSVLVKDVLEISSQPTIDDPLTQPIAPDNGIRFYTNNRDLGGTGLYFVHSDNTRDELISNNKSLVYSMLF